MTFAPRRKRDVVRSIRVPFLRSSVVRAYPCSDDRAAIEPGIGAGRLAMRLGVSGDLSGRLYLTGRPVIDMTTGKVLSRIKISADKP